jgi:hypothetical protein
LDEALIQWSGSSSAYRLFFNRPGILEKLFEQFLGYSPYPYHIGALRRRIRLVSSI